MKPPPEKRATYQREAEQHGALAGAAAPFRLMNGRKLAGVVHADHHEVHIRPEPGYRITALTLTVTLEPEPGDHQ